MNTDLVGLWLKHCEQVKHTTQAQALEQGKKANRSKYATFDLSYSGQRIYCGLKGCDWTAHVNEVPRERGNVTAAVAVLTMVTMGVILLAGSGLLHVVITKLAGVQ